MAESGFTSARKAYDALRRSRHWSGFTAAEIQHAQDYIRSLGGNAW
jgi:hypothetical protein